MQIRFYLFLYFLIMTLENANSSGMSEKEEEKWRIIIEYVYVSIIIEAIVS